MKKIRKRKRTLLQESSLDRAVWAKLEDSFYCGWEKHTVTDSDRARLHMDRTEMFEQAPWLPH